MNKIDRIGTYIGTVEESTLSVTPNGFPQWVARLKAAKKYISDKDEMAHYQLTEPGYVDWSSYDETIIAYMVLFTEKGPMLNYDQLKIACGWDGRDFQDLTGFGGKIVLFRVEEHTYKDKTGLQVNWIDDQNAPPERQLKAVDAGKAKELTAKFLAGMKTPEKPAVPTKAAVPAKPAPTVTTAAPATGAQPAAGSAAAPAAPTASPTTAAAPAATTPKATPPKKGKTPPPPAATSNPAPGLSKESTKEAAWEYVNEQRGATEEGVVAEAWISACAEVGENVDETAFTPEMWGKVRDTVLKDIGVTGK